jgi:hypothetical protein
MNTRLLHISSRLPYFLNAYALLQFASFGDYLLSYGILTMSIAPRDRHDAQVQFALERGLPAMIGALGTRRLPYPSRSFDMVHCAECHVSWTAHGRKEH